MRYLYKITNLINGKCYIGQASDYKKRISNHINGRPKHKSLIHLAIVKYGKENFKFEVLDEIVDEMIDGEERQAIITYNSLVPNGYNIESGGCLNKRHCLETRKKISSANKGKLRSQETKANISKGRKGKKRSTPLTEAAKRNMSEAQKGRKHTDETKLKCRLAHLGKKGHPVSDETKIKLSIANAGHVVTQETRNKISAGHKGKTKKKHSPEANKLKSLRQIGAGYKGRKNKKHSPEANKLKSLRMTGRKLSQETKDKIRNTHAKRKECTNVQ